MVGRRVWLSEAPAQMASEDTAWEGPGDAVAEAAWAERRLTPRCMACVCTDGKPCDGERDETLEGAKSLRRVREGPDCGFGLTSGGPRSVHLSQRRSGSSSADSCAELPGEVGGACGSSFLVVSNFHGEEEAVSAEKERSWR